MQKVEEGASFRLLHQKLTNIVVDIFFNDSFATRLLTENPLNFFLVLTIPFALHYVWLYSSYHQEVISNAAFVLGKIGNPIAIEHMIESFKRANAPIQHAEISKSISQFGDVAFPSVLLGLESNNPHIKIGCIRTLGELKNPKAVDPLLEILKIGKSKFGNPAIKALSQIGSPKAIQAISESLKFFEKSILTVHNQFFSIIKSYQELDAAVLERIIDDLQISLSKDNSFFRRHIILQAIGVFGHPDCTPILLDIIYDDSDDKMIRQQAISSLAYIKISDVPKMMVNIYDQFDELQDQVLDALEDVNNPSAIQSLHVLLGHEDWMIRKSAISSVVKIGNEESINQLKALHADENPKVRTELSKGLGILGIEEAIPILMILARDSSSDVRQEALASLDFAFPNFAHKEFLKLAVEIDYPERVKAVELLGNYRSSDVRNILISLCADVNNAVKTQAVNSLKRIDQNLRTCVKITSVFQ